MKSKYITTIILEGTDGVGKSTITNELFKIYNYRYMVYHRGELSNLFYALKYDRPFAATQNGLPFLHVLLTCNKSELRDRIYQRGFALHQSYEHVQSELDKINDQDEFIRLAKAMSNDYHFIILDTSGLSAEDTGKILAKRIDEYVANLENDKEISSWNKMYEKACKKLKLKFTTKANQPHINDVPFMSELTCQNGVYERFDNRDYPDNLIYSMAYDVKKSDIDKVKKQFDFAYIINSKIKRRPEVYDYLNAFTNQDLSCMISESDLIDSNLLRVRTPRMFGDEFIKTIAKARATVYCARDLAHLKMQTARLYEAILAEQIVFVDSLSDVDCDILNDIFCNETDIIKLLYVRPETICQNYKFIVTHPEMYDYILHTQRKWYDSLCDMLKGGQF